MTTPNIPAMQTNLEVKQTKHQVLQAQRFELGDALNAADTMCTKAKGFGELAESACRTAWLALADALENLDARIEVAHQQCVDQYNRVELAKRQQQVAEQMQPSWKASK